MPLPELSIPRPPQGRSRRRAASIVLAICLAAGGAMATAPAAHAAVTPAASNPTDTSTQATTPIVLPIIEVTYPTCDTKGSVSSPTVLGVGFSTAIQVWGVTIVADPFDGNSLVASDGWTMNADGTATWSIRWEAPTGCEPEPTATATPEPTVEPTATPTAEPTTTATPEPTATAEPTSSPTESTTAPGAGAPATPEPQMLAETGSELAPVIPVGIAALLAGAILVACRRRIASRE